MGSVLAKCRIGCQIAVLAVLGLAGMTVVVGINLWGTAKVDLSNGVVAAARDAGDLDGQLQVAMLQARRHEKDFLLRHDEKYVAMHAAAMAAASKALDGLQAQAAGHPAVLAQVEGARTGVGRYAAAFGEMVKAARTVGLNENLGLQGELRDRVHDAEAALQSADAPKAQVAMLMMRRHEKDFIARQDPKYGAQLKAELPAFTAALDAVAMDPGTKRRILADMTAYQDTFARFMAATLAGLDAVKALSATYTEIEPGMVALDAHFAASARAAVREGDEVAAATQRLVLLTLAVCGLVVLGLSWAVGRGIARPIIAVTRSMEALVTGDLGAEVPADARRDEIGTMVRAVRAFRDSLVEAARMRDAQAAQREAAATEKHAALVRMAEQIELGAGVSVKQIGERTTAMIAIAEEMGSLAGRTGNSARGAADAAALALGTAQTVASASEQLAASIREISGQVSHSAAVVNQAVQARNETRTKIEALNERVGLVGAVADIIGDIAAKTNLLALNATIEAARAGEAGKGFAVVASEVKQLATQTRRSTEEITTHINQIRAATVEAVAAVDRIETTISEIDGISGSIAAAVEQQGAATAEIARNVAETASAVNRMSGMNADVAREAEQAGRYADDVLENTRSLDRSVAELKQAMVRTVRTSTEEVDRRNSPRYEANLPCRVELAGKGAIPARIADISEGGARVIDLNGATAGARGTLRLDGIGSSLGFSVLQVNEGAVNIAFDASEATRQALQTFLDRAALPKAA